MSDEVEVIQVVRTRLLLRGNGKDDPIRRIVQYWSLDGALLAEVDPLKDDHIADFRGPKVTNPLEEIQDFRDWIEQLEDLLKRIMNRLEDHLSYGERVPFDPDEIRDDEPMIDDLPKAHSAQEPTNGPAAAEPAE